ncbi:MAG: cellulose synthase operon protein YhjQ [Pseudomonadales bacterium]|nr:cellulose synthase operon protein YhjQ [Pseudomonadales bacterium]
MKQVALASPKAGVGKTTVLTTLAHILADDGHSVLMIDLDEQNLLGLFMGSKQPSNSGLSSLYQEDGNAPGAFQPRDDVLVLPFGEIGSVNSRLLYKNLMNLEGLYNRLAKVFLRYEFEPDYVLYDTPYANEAINDCFLPAMDFVIDIIRPDLSSYASLLKLLNSGSTKERDKHCYLINQFSAQRQLDTDMQASMKHMLGEELLPYCIHQDAAMIEAIAAGKRLQDYQNDSQALSDCKKLSATLQSRVNVKEERVNDSCH